MDTGKVHMPYPDAPVLYPSPVQHENVLCVKYSGVRGSGKERYGSEAETSSVK